MKKSEIIKAFANETKILQKKWLSARKDLIYLLEGGNIEEVENKYIIKNIPLENKLK